MAHRRAQRHRAVPRATRALVTTHTIEPHRTSRRKTRPSLIPRNHGNVTWVQLFWGEFGVGAVCLGVGEASVP
jgi:hypothetical protein